MLVFGLINGMLLLPLPTVQKDNEHNKASKPKSNETSKLAESLHDFTEEHKLENINNDTDDEEDEEEEATSCPGCKNTDTISLLTNPPFMIICFTVMMFNYAYLGPYTYIPLKAVRLGIPEDKASYLVSVLSVSNVANRVVFGCIGNNSAKIRFWFLGSIVVLDGTLCTIIQVFCTYELLITFSVLLGVTAGLYYIYCIVLHKAAVLLVYIKHISWNFTIFIQLFLVLPSLQLDFD